MYSFFFHCSETIQPRVPSFENAPKRDVCSPTPEESFVKALETSLPDVPGMMERISCHTTMPIFIRRDRFRTNPGRSTGHYNQQQKTLFQFGSARKRCAHQLIHPSKESVPPFQFSTLPAEPFRLCTGNIVRFLKPPHSKEVAMKNYHTLKPSYSIPNPQLPFLPATCTARRRSQRTKSKRLYLF